MAILKFILKVVAWFSFIVIMVIGVLIAASAPTDEELLQETQSLIDDIERKVADEETAKYLMMQDNNAPYIERCVQAGLVAQAWLSVKDQSNYVKWQDVKEAMCASAGMPR